MSPRAKGERFFRPPAPRSRPFARARSRVLMGPAVPGDATDDGVWPYLGVGCVSAIAGLAAGGMIAVLISKIVGSVGGCAPDADTGAPCNWSTYWTWGGRPGMVLFPAVVLWRMRRSRRRSRNSEVRGTGSGTR